MEVAIRLCRLLIDLLLKKKRKKKPELKEITLVKVNNNRLKLFIKSPALIGTNLRAMNYSRWSIKENFDRNHSTNATFHRLKPRFN